MTIICSRVNQHWLFIFVHVCIHVVIIITCMIYVPLFYSLANATMYYQCICAYMCVSMYMYLHMQARPGTENDDFDELMQTYVYTPSSPQTTSPSTKKDTPPEPDPEASLITDFQVVTDIKVNSCILKRTDTSRI